MSRFVGVLILLLLTSGGVVSGQSLSDVYVTTQRNASLRAGPGASWDRLTVIPYGTTLQATGRTISADWIQVRYDGELPSDARTDVIVNDATYGWIASWLLVWTGNILELPVDGVSTVPIVRAAGSIIVAYPGMPIYEGSAGPSRRVEYPLDGVAYVEVTGRLGSTDTGYFWIQFKVAGQFYWTPSWAVGVPANHRALPDAAYLYPYGRLTMLTEQNIARTRQILSDIGGRWTALSNGQPTSCSNIPEDLILLDYREQDLLAEILFSPAAEALISVEIATNRALELFREVCTSSTRTVDSVVISNALEGVRVAEQNLNLVSLLLLPLERRDPLLAQ